MAARRRRAGASRKPSWQLGSSRTFRARLAAVTGAHRLGVRELPVDSARQDQQSRIGQRAGTAQSLFLQGAIFSTGLTGDVVTESRQPARRETKRPKLRPSTNSSNFARSVCRKADGTYMAEALNAVFHRPHGRHGSRQPGFATGRLRASKVRRDTLPANRRARRGSTRHIAAAAIAPWEPSPCSFRRV